MFQTTNQTYNNHHPTVFGDFSHEKNHPPADLWGLPTSWLGPAGQPMRHLDVFYIMAPGTPQNLTIKHGKTWENMGKYWKLWENMEKHGKNMGKYGKLWDNDGKIMGK